MRDEATRADLRAAKKNAAEARDAARYLPDLALFVKPSRLRDLPTIRRGGRSPSGWARFVAQADADGLLYCIRGTSFWTLSAAGRSLLAASEAA